MEPPGGPPPGMGPPMPKMGGVSPGAMMGLGAGMGGMIGAGYGAMRPPETQRMRDQVERLQGQPGAGGFQRAVQIAKSQQQLSQAEGRARSPMRSAITGGLTGAAIGAGALPAGAKLVSTMKKHGPDAAKYIKRLLG